MREKTKPIYTPCAVLVPCASVNTGPRAHPGAAKGSGKPMDAFQRPTSEGCSRPFLRSTLEPRSTRQPPHPRALQNSVAAIFRGGPTVGPRPQAPAAADHNSCKGFKKVLPRYPTWLSAIAVQWHHSARVTVPGLNPKSAALPLRPRGARALFRLRISSVSSRSLPPRPRPAMRTLRV